MKCHLFVLVNQLSDHVFDMMLWKDTNQKKLQNINIKRIKDRKREKIIDGNKKKNLGANVERNIYKSLTIKVRGYFFC